MAMARAMPATKSKTEPALPTSSKPTYAVMVKQAIAELKDRTGSSIPAISNYISSNFGGLNKVALVAALKKGVQDESLVKVSVWSGGHLIVA
jgi:linker histone H1 and H5 family